MITHTFNTIHGAITIGLDIIWLSDPEAIDAYNLDPFYFNTGGWLVNGFANGEPLGQRFYSPSHLGDSYQGGETEGAATDFLKVFHGSQTR